MTDTSFVVRGEVDGCPTVARWRNGRLDADPELVRRAQIVVALEEHFTADDLDYAVQADLNGGIATVLTVMRAFSRVTSVDLATGGL